MVYNNHNSTYCNTNRYNRRHLLLNYRFEHQRKYRSYNSKYKYSRHLHSNIYTSCIRRLFCSDNNRLATENGTLKTALAALNLPQNTRSATPQVSRVALIPTFVRQPALVIQQTPAPSAAPVIPVAPRGALGGALGYQANFQPSPTGHSGVVRKFDNARSEVYVDIGKKHGVSEGSVLMIQRGERTIGNANVTFAFGESALGRMQGDGKPAAGDKAVKIR